MIILREHREEDAPLMLEWMHDLTIQKSFKKNMAKTTLAAARDFCKSAAIPYRLTDGVSIHFAIADADTDEYLGTISLKDIDIHNKAAEYAIATRKEVHGKGIAKQATGLILKKAFSEYGLHRVYLNVLADNDAAIRLYERCGFTFEGEFRDHLRMRDKYMNWKWYGILDNEYDEQMFIKGQ